MCMSKRSTWEIIFLTLYVDDILLVGNNFELIEASYVLGVEVIQSCPKMHA